MIKELLEKQQPIVYHALENACQSNRISSAYLFTGPYGTPKYEAALLLAQSILCEKQGSLACEECNTCRRVCEGIYADMIILDGKEETISKDMVDEIQEKFSKTALEKNGQRIYIIKNAENATIAAQNSMLKFLEEPGVGVTAILTTDNVNRMLPTIISRCTVLPFMPKNEQDYYSDLLQVGVKEEAAYFMSHIVKDMSDLKNMYDENDQKCTTVFEHICGMLKQYLNCEGLRKEELSVDWEVNWSSKAKDSSTSKKENLLILSGFCDLLTLFCHDVITHHEQGASWYIQSIQKYYGKEEQCAKILEIALNSKDACNKYNDLHLVLYQSLYELGGVK